MINSIVNELDAKQNVSFDRWWNYRNYRSSTPFFPFSDKIVHEKNYKVLRNRKKTAKKIHRKLILNDNNLYQFFYYYKSVDRHCLLSYKCLLSSNQISSIISLSICDALKKKKWWKFFFLCKFSLLVEIQIEQLYNSSR